MRGERLRRKEALGALGIVVDDVGAERYFTETFSDQLTHLQRDETGELGGARTQDSRGLRKHRGPLGERLLPPFGEAAFRLRDRFVDFRVSVVRKLFDELAVVRVD